MKRTILTPALRAYFAGLSVEPIGFLPSGRPVFPIAGGADNEPAGGDDKPDDKPADFQPIASQADLDRVLGERLARERAKFADYADLQKKAAEFDKAAEAARTEHEKAVEAAKNEGRTEALTTANSRLVSAEARALAAEARFRNPVLAVRAVDLKDVAVNDVGEVDAAAIKAKLKELSDADPYLLEDGKKPAPKADKSQGGGKGDDKPSVNRGKDMFESRRAKKTSA